MIDCVSLESRVTKREEVTKMKIFHTVAHSQMVTISWAVLGQSQEPGASSGTLISALAIFYYLPRHTERELDQKRSNPGLNSAL